MKRLLLVATLLTTQAHADDATTLCATNPAYTRQVMLEIVQAQLLRDHDPALDADTPDHLADQATAQGISECAAELRADPSIAAALADTDKADRSIAWDAYNTACADHKASRGACIAAETGAAKALKHLMAPGSPPAAKTLVQACQLILQPDLPMTDWRQCVDQALALHPTQDRAAECKLSANWHVSHTGAEAGAALAACLRK